MTKRIAVVGCGWLGLPLATAMVSRGFHVYGSTTSEHKIAQLASSGITPFLVKADLGQIEGPVSKLLTNCDILVLTIPPGKSGANYPETIRNLANLAKQAGISEIIFTSSISVYPEADSIYTESDKIDDIKSPTPHIIAAEQVVRQLCPLSTILRLGGLVGGERHPVKFVGQKTAAHDPDAPINLVHRDDCIELILQLIEKEIKGELFNVVAPYHPGRFDYYSRKARSINLPDPTFSAKTGKRGKIVSSRHIMTTMDYVFSVTSEI
jgi:nucleoside-diphosphate-sugar epimerase